jgi:hypothetical protein
MNSKNFFAKSYLINEFNASDKEAALNFHYFPFAFGKQP